MTEGNICVDKIRGQFPDAVLDVSEFRGDTTITLKPSFLLDVSRFLRDDSELRFDLLSFVSAVDRLGLPVEPRFIVVIGLCSLKHRRRLLLNIPTVGDPPHCPSVTSVWSGANWHERETFDLLGVVFDGHPSLIRIMMPEGWQGHPLRKDYDVSFEPVHFSATQDDPWLAGLGTQTMSAPSAEPPLPPGWKTSPDTMIVNMGPQHPATHGVLRFVLELDGERIVRAWTDLGHLHSGIEKSMESKTYMQGMVYADRMDYTAGLCNQLGLVLAVEKMLGLEVPPRAQALRVILAELQRLAAHCIFISSVGLDLSGMIHSLLMYVYAVREQILDIIEMVSGARLTPTWFTVGGLRADVPEAFVPTMRNFIKVFPVKLREWEAMLTNNPIFVSRVKGIGHLPLATAIALGVTGPTLRGSGSDYDVRKFAPYSGYEQYDFDIPHFPEGDCYARYLVRVEEMRQSLRIIEQALNKLPDGPVKVEDHKITLPSRAEMETSMEGLIHHFKLITEGLHVPAGASYMATEGSKGELGYYIYSTGGPKPHRLKIRGPSFSNISAAQALIPGEMIPDLVAVIATIDICMGEVDR
jgi:NADH-quinone oxidoreductase subunit C/D